MTLSQRSFALAALALLAPAALAQADKGTFDPATRVYTSQNLKFSIKVPDGWQPSPATTAVESYFDKKGNEDMGACVSTLDAGTPLAAEVVVHHIDLSQFKSTSDQMTTQAGWPARRIDGTAVSEGQKLVVFTISIKPGEKAEIIQLSIWGPPDDMSGEAVRKEVDLLLSSLKPTP